MKYSTSFVLLCLSASLACAQPGMRPDMRPEMQPPVQPQMLTATQHGPYKDSAAFNAAFAELYPLIRPTPNVRETAEQMLSRMGPVFKIRHIDSTQAFDTAMQAIDPNMDKKILFDAYRAQFSATEIKELAHFFKTPVGRHYLEVELPLAFARTNELQQQIAQTIYRALAPMMKTAAEKRSEAKPEPPSLHPPVKAQ